MMKLLLLLLGPVVARVLRQERPTPAGWRVVEDRAPRSTALNLQLALKVPSLEADLEAVSTPGSPRFHHYLTTREIAERVPGAGAALLWARCFGSADLALTGDWIYVRTDVARAEVMLQTTFATLEFEGMRKLHAMTTYEIPDDLEEVIDFVAGIHSFLAVGRAFAQQGRNDTNVAFAAVTPTVLDELYALPAFSATTRAVNSQTTQAVVQFGDNFSDEDLETFYRLERPELSGQTVHVVGPNDPDGRLLGEANLDTQYSSAIGMFVNTTDYFLNYTSDPAGMLQWAWMVSNETDAPKVHSISYGEYGGSYDNATVQRFSYELQKFGLLGITVTLASGDNGVGCSRTLLCGRDDTAQEFDFPSSPYITMVGGTQLDEASRVETGATLSSGGFSADYATPAWQLKSVEEYVDKLDTKKVKVPSEAFTATGKRGYPDLSAIGQNVQVVVNGRLEGIGGTSCSSPIVAGIVALLNAQLIQQGLPTMGFLNPFLYAHPDAFNDVTAGSNPYGCCDGFEASEGWDPVTGLGTPHFPAMLAYALHDSKAAFLAGKDDDEWDYYSFSSNNTAGGLPPSSSRTAAATAKES